MISHYKQGYAGVSSRRRWKEVVFTAGILSIALFGFSTGVGALTPKNIHRAPSSGTHPSKEALVEAAIRMKTGASVSSVAKISKNDNGAPIVNVNSSGTPFFIDGESMSRLTAGMSKIASGTSAEDAALDFIIRNSSVFMLETPREELRASDIVRDDNGTVHIRFQQMYQGLPVSGNELTLHLDESLKPYAFNGRYDPTPAGIDVNTVSITADVAIGKARADLLSFTTIEAIPEAYKPLMRDASPKTELCIRFMDETGTPHLAWCVDIYSSVRNRWYYYIDAVTGVILEKFEAASSAASVSATALDYLGVIRTFNVSLESGVYSLYDMNAAIYTYDAKGKVVSATNTPTIVTSSNNTWIDPIAVSAHSNLRAVYDYYLGVHGRKGIDGAGGDMPAVIHYTEDGKPLDNAFWNGQFIAFGDAQPYAAALDVVGHELTHGVVEHTAGLEYKNQSGALNEAIADVMATFIDPDWEIAEDVPKGPIRDISNPHRFGLPENMSEYKNYPVNYDYGGVHTNMSIPSRAAYLTAEDIGREKTAAIWYTVMKNLYLTPKSQFVDMRLGAIRAAKDLFGDSSTEVAAVTSAFDTVGIVGDTPSEPPADIPALEGEEFIAFVLDNGYNLSHAISTPDLTSAKDIIYPTRTPLTSEGSSPMTVCKGGSFLMFIDASGSIRKLDLKTYEETVVFNTTPWSSIKLSPDGSKLAATTVFADSSIYLFDLLVPENSRSIPLYTPSTEGVELRTALYADALDWDSTGTQLIYDSFHSMPVVGGSPLEFWDVNILDITTDIITRVKTPSNNNTQVGNPSFAETNDRYIVCDRFSEELGTASMVTIDLYTLDMATLYNAGMLPGNIPNLGHPKYSPDDSKIIFQQYSYRYGDYVLSTIPLKSDKMTPSGSSKIYYYGSLADWFVKEDPTDVDETDDGALPAAVSLDQNVPNPFNPDTVISFTLAKEGHVRLTVYDLLGREVARLADSPMSTGRHSVRFDGANLASGVYFYRIEAGGRTATRKMTLVK